MVELPPLRRDQVRDIDRRTIEELGLPGVVLMENAGRSVALWLRELGVKGPVVVCCGRGNNGGDGIVVARHLDAWGIAVHLIFVTDPSELRGDAAINFAVADRASIPWSGPDPELNSEETAALLQEAEWVIDALLGTGARGALRGTMPRAIENLNRSPARKLAIDLPSGLDCDSGEPLGPTVCADYTATFVALKAGFTNPASRQYTGEVRVFDIGVPRVVLAFYTEGQSGHGPGG